MAKPPAILTSPKGLLSPPAIPEPEEAQHVGLAPVITAGLVVIAIFIGGFGAWASLAPLDSAAVAPGRVVIESNRKTVKHLEGGIVDEILVQEGDEVSAGQVLIRLDQTRARATLEQLRSAHWAANALAARLVAERDDTGSVTFPEWLLAERDDPRVRTMLASQVNVFEARKRAYSGQVAILLQQIGQSEEEIIGLQGEITSEVRQLSLLEEEIVSKETLLEKGLIEKPQVLALKRHQAQLNGSRSRNKASIARVRKNIGEARLRISELQTTQVNQAVAELQEVEIRIFDLEERLRHRQNERLSQEPFGECHRPGIVTFCGQACRQSIGSPMGGAKLLKGRPRPRLVKADEDLASTDFVPLPNEDLTHYSAFQVLNRLPVTLNDHSARRDGCTVEWC